MHEDGNVSRHDRGDPGGGGGFAELVDDGLEDGEAGVDDAEEGFEACEEGDKGEDLLSVCAVVPLDAVWRQRCLRPGSRVQEQVLGANNPLAPAPWIATRVSGCCRKK